jgi:hypothetical protein
MEAPSPDIQKHIYDLKLLLDKGADMEEITASLKTKGIEQEKIEKIVAYLKKAAHKKRVQMGNLLILTGVILLGLGFISCIFLHDAGMSVDIALYGLTGLGALILVIGLFLLFN